MKLDSIDQLANAFQVLKEFPENVLPIFGRANSTLVAATLKIPILVSKLEAEVGQSMHAVLDIL